MPFIKVMSHETVQNPASARTKRWREQNRERYLSYERARYRGDPAVRAKSKARAHRWYKENTEHARRSVREGRYRKRAFLVEVVGAACVDCGDDRPGAVEYHHPGGKEKGQVPLTHLSWDRLREEALHLIALCGACHGVRHHKEDNIGPSKSIC